MSPTLLAACVDCAMDDAFWAKQPALAKTAGDASSYDDGMVSIGGVKIPRQALYGLALGGLGGAAGGVAGGVDPKTMALLALLGAAAGTVGGYGLHAVDANTASSSDPTQTRAQEQLADAKSRDAAAADAAKSGGLATVTGRLVNGQPTTNAASIPGTLAQAGGGAYLGAKGQQAWRANKLNNALRDGDSADDIDRLLGVEASKPPKKGKGDSEIAPPPRGYEGLADRRQQIIENRRAEPQGTLKDQLKADPLSAPRSLFAAGRRTLGGDKLFGEKAFEPAPRDFAYKPGSALGEGQAARGKALAEGFSSNPFSPKMYLHNKGGAVGGGLGALALSLLPQIGAKPSEAAGILPLASLINHAKGAH